MAEELDHDDWQASLGLQGGIMDFKFDLCKGEFSENWLSSSDDDGELPLSVSDDDGELPIPEDEWDDAVVTVAAANTAAAVPAATAMPAAAAMPKFKSHSNTAAAAAVAMPILVQLYIAIRRYSLLTLGESPSLPTIIAVEKV
jgi:hypothetical protein